MSWNELSTRETGGKFSREATGEIRITEEMEIIVNPAAALPVRELGFVF
jgi:hypothetical protein